MNLTKALLVTMTLLILVQPMPLFAESIKIRFTVLDQDNPKKGIECKICLLDLNEKENIIDATDEEGKYEGTLSCKRGEKIKITPISTRYYPYFLKCPINNTTNVIKVSKVYYISNLERNALWLEKQGKIGDAALVNNEIFARVINIDEDKANRARIKTIELTAQKLIVESAMKYDTKQGKVVATRNMVRMVKEHQQANKIKASGKLDYNTLRSMSDKDIGHFIYKAPAGKTMY
ncbi:MAG: hypothetical protein JRC89_09735 [Deltaproteobacteria bacterium]|nr:hypothetical protein [Deltaproteobacteria bacterium]